MSNQSVVDQVRLELAERRKLGVDVPQRAFRVAEECAADLRAGGMKISEIADLCIRAVAR